MSVLAKNPILPGFYPDPSICVVGEDFYIVNSSFAYFPGLPVMHSKDLAHWEQIGNAMDRTSQLPLEKTGHSRGLFAPTIRYNNGTFYIICTNVSYGGNFIITATDPAGPWSEPYYIEGADGIDPSLFFDEDGTCYYIGTHPNPDGCKYDGDWYIWIQELDIEKMELTGGVHNVWNGAMKNIIWPEGPHLYKKDGYYYIMHAEGGTGPDHAVTICRSKNIMGPYENNFCNPILTHRHLGKDYPVKYVGHADLVKTAADEWYMVMLAVRPQNRYTTMGRETFLARVEWENGWPVVNPGVGMLTETLKINLPEWKPSKDNTADKAEYDFGSMDAVGCEFLTLRNPEPDMYVLEKGNGLKVKCCEVTLKDEASPAYVALRQRHHGFRAGACFDTRSLGAGTKAGIAYVQSNAYHLRVEAGSKAVQVILCENGQDKTVASLQIETERMTEAAVTVRNLQAEVEIRDQNGEVLFRSEKISVANLSTEVAGGFVGCTVGMYAVTKEGSDEVCFQKFSYCGLVD